MDEQLLTPQNKIAKIFKGFFFGLVFVFVLVVFWVSGSYLGYVPSGNLPSFLNLRNFPEKESPKDIKLTCSLGGEEYVLEHTLYGTVNEYYKKDPLKKRKFLSSNYESFVYSDPADDSISELVEKIKNLGLSRGLSEDRIADLVICFTQSIPYDSEKARIILSYPQGAPIIASDLSLMVSRYPYETLYDGTGICTDKSYLLAYMLKDLGYGTSIMIFDKDQHMAVGIKSPSGYTSFGSGYSFIETTNTGYKVGQLPMINRDSGEAASLEIQYMEGLGNSEANFIIPDPVEGNINPPNDIIPIVDGKEYLRVIELAQIKGQIKALISAINQKDLEIKEKRGQLDILAHEVSKKEAELKNSESALRETEDNYKQNSTQKNYQEYLKAYNQYTESYNKFDYAVKSYNQSVASFNILVAAFNSSVKDYNYLINLD